MTRPAPHDWPMTALPGATVSPLGDETRRLQMIESAYQELWIALGTWRQEYDRVLKAFYGYEWIRLSPAESSADLLAAEAAYFEARKALAALVEAA